MLTNLRVLSIGSAARAIPWVRPFSTRLFSACRVQGLRVFSSPKQRRLLKPAAIRKRTFMVQRMGETSWAEIVINSSDAVSVARLKDDIKEKFPSLRGVGPDIITLRLFVGTGADGEDTSVPLDSMDTLEQALGKASSQAGLSLDMDKLRIVVHVTEVATAEAAAAGAGSTFPLSVDAMAPLEYTHDVSRAVASIRSGLVTEHADGHLLLPENVKWPGASNNVLVVRHFAAPLFESVLNRCMRRIVTGEPGVGKSVWAWYAIYRILTEQPSRTVIYANSTTGLMFVIPPAERGPIRVAPLCEEVLAALGIMRGLGESPLLLADSVLPPMLPFPTVVIASSGVLAALAATRVGHRLNTFAPRRLCVPAPTADDVLALKALATTALDVKGARS